jgi:hypothetical protein
MSDKLTNIPDSPFAALSALGIAFSPVGLVIPEGLPVEDWQTLMSLLPRMGDAVRWALGDALNYGEARYGNKYTAAMDATGIKKETLIQYASLARRFETCTRVHVLSWSHHREVADLPITERGEWLLYAAENRLTTRALREAINAAEEEEKALAETASKRRALPASEQEDAPQEREPEFAPPIGKKHAPEPAPAPDPSDRLIFEPLVPREPKPDPKPARPALGSVGEPTAPAPRTELNWRNVCRAVFNFTAGTKSLTYIFEIIEVRTDGGFAYDITNNGNALGRRSTLAGAKQRCEEYMAETLKKAEGK